jgi:hypothetical protein
MKILRTLKSSKMHIFNIWTWPTQLIDDIRQWRIVRKALTEEEVKQGFASFKYELRIDNVGRIYTVINIPEELYPYEKRDMVWPWMLEQLRELDDILMRVRLNDLVYPEVTKLEDAPAYLVILSPSIESISLGKFLRWIFNCGVTFFTLYLINAIVSNMTGNSIIGHFLSLF